MWSSLGVKRYVLSYKLVASLIVIDPQRCWPMIVNSLGPSVSKTVGIISPRIFSWYNFYGDQLFRPFLLISVTEKWRLYVYFATNLVQYWWPKLAQKFLEGHFPIWMLQIKAWSRSKSKNSALRYHWVILLFHFYSPVHLITAVVYQILSPSRIW